MGGGLIQLASYGVADQYLTSQPEITYFRLLYKRHTNFAIEAIQQSFAGSVDFGKKATVAIARTGDLITNVWLQVTVPDLRDYDTALQYSGSLESDQPLVTKAYRTTSTEAVLHVTKPQTVGSFNGYSVQLVDDLEAVTTQTSAGLTSTITLTGLDPARTYTAQVRPSAPGPVYGTYSPPRAVYALRWCNSLGHALISSVELEMGGSRIDKTVSEFFDIWSELTEKDGHMQGFYEMVGKYDEYDVFDNSSYAERTYYIPLIFYFNRSVGSAIPLVALQFHEVKLNWEFRDYLSLIRSDIPINQLVSIQGGQPLSLKDASVYCDFVYLDSEERRRFSSIPHEFLVHQVQFLGDEVVLSPSEPGGTLTRKIDLGFNHPVKELIFVYVPDEKLDRDAVAGNDHFSYGLPDSTDDVFTSVKLSLNGNDRFSARPGAYFRLVQPYQHHTRCPKKKVYTYSFAISPEEFQPSGSCNFSRVDQATMYFSLHPSTPRGKLKVFALGMNILRIASGLSGLAYAS